MGYASAMAMLLLAVSLAVTLVILRNSRRFVHYQGPDEGERRRARRAPVERRAAVRGAAQAAS